MDVLSGRRELNKSSAPNGPFCTQCVMLAWSHYTDLKQLKRRLFDTHEAGGYFIKNFQTFTEIKWMA